jgi:hypothetical protein
VLLDWSKKMAEDGGYRLTVGELGVVVLCGIGSVADTKGQRDVACICRDIDFLSEIGPSDRLICLNRAEKEGLAVVAGTSVGRQDKYEVVFSQIAGPTHGDVLDAEAEADCDCQIDQEQKRED